MFEFELDNAAGMLENLNTRTEKIGAERIPAADLKFACPLSPDVLAFFSPTLKHSLFDVDSKDLLGGMTVRDPHMVYPLARDEEMTGCKIEIEYGIGKPMVFTEVTVNQFRITPNNGGTVLVGFRAQCRPDEKQIGKLYMLQDRPITITVVPPELDPVDGKTAATPQNITPLRADLSTPARPA